MSGPSSEIEIVVLDQQSMGKDVVQREYRGFVPLTRFDEAFLLLRHRLGLKVRPDLLVQLINPGPGASFDDKDLHEKGRAGVEAVRGGRRDVGIAFEGVRKFHQFGPVLLSDLRMAHIEARKPARREASA